MTTFTKEQLQQIEAAAKEALWPVVWSEKKARAHFSEKITPEVVLELARIALLSLCTDTQAQPVSEPYKLNGWISVDNELPEEGVRVLVFSDGAFVLLAEFTGGEFYDVVRDGEEFFETVTRCVTHWMPLPAAPAQDSE
ncbi:DUF551 domain-containing protein [Hafnia paralvei]|uniref:DUF551 domain-containing protein n=1 Tax=Hafnia paralvei TaxID=546367 RepID=UPI003EE78417